VLTRDFRVPSGLSKGREGGGREGGEGGSVVTRKNVFDFFFSIFFR